MASRREQIQDDTRLRVLRLLNDNPKLSTREIAKIVGISNGSTYYCVNAMIEKGMIKIGNFNKSQNKKKYAYFLTPRGIYEKSFLASKFLKRKLQEYKDLKREIEEIETEVNSQVINLNIKK